jgi:chorismate mutase
MQNLSIYRQELKSLSSNILNHLHSRKLLVAKIQNEKKTTGEYKNFDIQREVILFESLKNELSSYSLKELFIFSMMIEAHAGSDSEYPAWSSQVHILDKQNNITGQINPVLLATIHKSSYDSLQINEKFIKILNPLLGK